MYYVNMYKYMKICLNMFVFLGETWQIALIGRWDCALSEEHHTVSVLPIDPLVAFLGLNINFIFRFTLGGSPSLPHLSCVGVEGDAYIELLVVGIAHILIVVALGMIVFIYARILAINKPLIEEEINNVTVLTPIPSEDDGDEGAREVRGGGNKEEVMNEKKIEVFSVEVDEVVEIEGEGESITQVSPLSSSIAQVLPTETLEVNESQQVEESIEVPVLSTSNSGSSEEDLLEEELLVEFRSSVERDPPLEGDIFHAFQDNSSVFQESPSVFQESPSVFQEIPSVFNQSPSVFMGAVESDVFSLIDDLSWTRPPPSSQYSSFFSDSFFSAPPGLISPPPGLTSPPPGISTPPGLSSSAIGTGYGAINAIDPWSQSIAMSSWQPTIDTTNSSYLTEGGGSVFRVGGGLNTQSPPYFAAPGPSFLHSLDSSSDVVEVKKQEQKEE